MGEGKKIIGSNACPVQISDSAHASTSRNPFRSGAFSGRLLTKLAGGAALLAVSSTGCTVFIPNYDSLSPEAQKREEKHLATCLIATVSATAVAGGGTYALLQTADDKQFQPGDKVVLTLGAAAVTGLVVGVIACSEPSSGKYGGASVSNPNAPMGGGFSPGGFPR